MAICNFNNYIAIFGDFINLQLMKSLYHITLVSYILFVSKSESLGINRKQRFVSLMGSRFL